MHKAADRAFVFSFLAIFAVLAFGSALRESPTVDEGTYLTSGYVYWLTGKYAFLPAEPPLLPLWASLPLLGLSLKRPFPIPAWLIQSHFSLASYFLYHNTLHPDSILNASRWMVVMLGILLGYLVWRWSHEALGKEAGRASLIAFAFCPPLLALGHLVTTDFAVTLGGFSALYCFWRMRTHPALARSLLFGIMVGITLMSKFTGLMIIPVLVLVAVVDRKLFPTRPRPSLSWVVHATLVFSGAAAVILVLYRTAGLYYLIQEIAFMRNLALLQTTGSFLVMGHRYADSSIFFPAICFFVKTPVPFLVLTGLSIWWVTLDQSPSARMAFTWALIPAAFYFVLLTWSHHCLGIRRLLLMYPLLCVAIGGSFAHFERRSRILKGFYVLLGVVYAATSVSIFPSYLSSFNMLAGGTSNGYRYFAGSNSDWGQGLKALGDYLRRQNVSSIYLNYFGSVQPGVYGIHYISIDPLVDANVKLFEEPDLDLRREKRTFLAISATNLSGLSYPDQRLFQWLRTKRPQAVMLGSILVFDVTGDPLAHAHLADFFALQGRTELSDKEHRWALALKQESHGKA